MTHVEVMSLVKWAQPGFSFALIQLLSLGHTQHHPGQIVKVDVYFYTYARSTWPDFNSIRAKDINSMYLCQEVGEYRSSVDYIYKRNFDMVGLYPYVLGLIS